MITAAGALALLALVPSAPAGAEDKLGAGITMYFQMGGNPGDGATLPRTNGARAAAAAFGVSLKEQYSGWQPETMLKQFREALAASPVYRITGFGNETRLPVADAEKRNIVITSETRR
jgi:simple sugar transport system substrate-binding protein